MSPRHQGQIKRNRFFLWVLRQSTFDECVNVNSRAEEILGVVFSPRGDRESLGGKLVDIFARYVPNEYLTAGCAVEARALDGVVVNALKPRCV